MGLVVQGKWTDNEPAELKRNSQNIRFSKGFENFITKKSTDYQPEPRRYCIYVNYTCPWSHLVMIGRLLKGLEAAIDLVFLDPIMGPKSWQFQENYIDPEIDARHLYELYIRSRKDFTGRITIPILWDKRTKTIVNNNSTDILHMFESEFNDHNQNCEYSLWSKNFPEQAKKLSIFISEHINDGIYKCLLAQEGVDKKNSERKFFKALALLNSLLQGKQYLIDTEPTEPDWRLFVTLIRFELIYANLFFTSKYSLDAFENIQNFLARLFTHNKIANTINLYETVRGYYGTLKKNDEVPDIDMFVNKLIKKIG